MKNIMKKKKYIMVFIVGLIFPMFIVYGATIVFESENVGYDNSNTELQLNNVDVNNVQDAIDSISNKLNDKVTTCSINLSNCQYTIPETTFEIGDYFTLVPDKTSFTIKSHITGYTSDQTINPSELSLWRIIDIHLDGTVDAVSEYVSSTKINFKGTPGYKNFIGALQTISTAYAKVGYTRSTRIIGYAGQTSTLQDTSVFDGTISTAPATDSTPYLETGIGQEYSYGVLGDTLYLRDYQLVNNLYGNMLAKKVGTSTPTDYWLASRAFNYEAADEYDFYGRRVSSSGDIYSICFFRFYYDGWINERGESAIRPIITLNNIVTISGGTGTKANPFTLS